MTDDQKNRSRIIANSFQTPNAHVDDVMRYLTGDEYKVLNFAVRHIMGWQDSIQTRQSCMSLSMFEKGFVTKKGHEFGGVGLSRKTIVKVLITLVEYRLLVKVGKPSNKGQMYSVGEDPDFDALEARDASKHKQEQAKMEKVRIGRETPGGVSHSPVYDIHQGGVSHTPPGGVSHTLNQTHTNPSLQTHSSGKPDTASEDPPSKSRNILMDVACRVWSIQPGGYAAQIIGLLKGTAPRGQWREHRLDESATPQEVLGFGLWWRETYAGASIPEKPESIADAFTRFRAKTAYRDFLQRGDDALARFYSNPTNGKPAPEHPAAPEPEPDRVTVEEMQAIKRSQQGESDESADTTV